MQLCNVYCCVEGPAGDLAVWEGREEAVWIRPGRGPGLLCAAGRPSANIGTHDFVLLRVH
jgi:hypothetical protein